MSASVTPTSREVLLGEDEVLISKTDLQGRITYANRALMRVSGYSEQGLLGHQHNIIRHPDMPRGTFRLLWKTLRRGDEFFVFVKNRAMDGAFYWDFANVTSDHDMNDKTLGYFSVRRRANAKGVQKISELYREMLEMERREGVDTGPDVSMAWLLEQIQTQGMSYDEFILGLQAL